MFPKLSAKIAAIVALLFGSLFLFGHGQPLHAQSCSDSSYSYNSSCSGSSTSAGTTVASSSTVVSAANATAGLVLNRVATFRAGGAAPGQTANGSGTKQLLGFGTGYAAGNHHGDNPVGFWVNGAFTRTTGSADGNKFEGDSISTMVGIDVRPSSRHLFGIGLGYETGDTETTYNSGNIDSTGFTIAPYMSVGLTEVFSLDAVGGYSMISYDQDRIDPLSSAKITGSNDADRWFGSVNIVGNWTMDKLLLGAKVGTLYISEEQDALTESDGTAIAKNEITVGNANVGVRLGLDGEMARPYISGQYSYDYNDAGGAYDAKSTFGGALGLDLRISDHLFINVEGSGTQKTDLRTLSGSATLRFQKTF